jgi:hypothetical protein
MLADGAEAKARADNPHDDEQIEQIVRWVIEDRLAKGQFDRTDLTLKDLDTIRRTLSASLKGMYHPRLRYPDASLPSPTTPSLARLPQDTPPAGP